MPLYKARIENSSVMMEQIHRLFPAEVQSSLQMHRNNEGIMELEWNGPPIKFPEYFRAVAVGRNKEGVIT